MKRRMVWIVSCMFFSCSGLAVAAPLTRLEILVKKIY